MLTNTLFLFLMTTTISLSLLSPASAKEPSPAEQESRIQKWQSEQLKFSIMAIFKNIVGATEILKGLDATDDTRGLPGAVIAAPSTSRDTLSNEVHDYNWTWKRDAAIVMKSVFNLWQEGYFPNKDNELFKIMKNYVIFSRQDQLNPDKGQYKLGDAKVTLNNLPNRNEWGGPQTDGPALQNLTLIPFLHRLESLNSNSAISPQENSETQLAVLDTITTNTLYTLESYDKLNVDTWEEVKAKSHFATLVVQEESLKQALEIIEASSRELRQQASYRLLKNHRAKIKRVLTKIRNKITTNHLSSNRGYILAHHGVEHEMSSMRIKDGNLDTQVNLAILQVFTLNQLGKKTSDLSPSSPWMRATAERQRQIAIQRYSVNRNGLDEHSNPIPGYIDGRYEEDKHFDGQPWVLTSLAKAKGYLSDAIESTLRGKIIITDLDHDYFLNLKTGISKSSLAADTTISKEDPRFEPIIAALVTRAKSIFHRLMIHTGQDHMLTEVLDGKTGFKMGIEHLTWSYVEFVNASRLLSKADDMGLVPKAQSKSSNPEKSRCGVVLDPD